MSTIAAPTSARMPGAPAAAAVACAHCALPVPRGLIRPGATAQFCCHGCETAYTLIQSCDLSKYYALRDRLDPRGPEPVRATAKRYAEFDDPIFRSLHTRPLPGGRLEADLFLENMHCAACVWLIEKLPAVVPGVIECSVDIRRSMAHVTWDAAAVPLSRVARALDSLGYAPHPARAGEARSGRRMDDRRAMIRLAVAGACAGNVMLLALALYAGMFDAMEAQYRELFRWLSMGITLVSLAWPGAVFFRSAWAAIRTRTPHLDLPIAIGLAAGGIAGVVNTVRGAFVGGGAGGMGGAGEIYFDSVAVLVFLLLAGRWIQRSQQRTAVDSVELLFSLTPTSARVVDSGGGDAREVSIEALRVGDLVEIRAGDSIPADGVVEAGASAIDLSLLTGEPRPVEVTIGDSVAAGAVNLSGLLRVRVQAAGESTRVGRLMRTVEEASRRRAPIVRFADRLSGWFVLGMLSLSLVTLLVWLRLDPANAVDHAAALLIVTCPCALGLATPLALTVALGRAAQRGILIKGGDVLERLARPGTIFLDKTGTLTQGRMALQRWVGDETVKPLVAAIEAQSSHPIAVALARDLGVDPAVRVGPVEQFTGHGISGQAAGRLLRVGSPAFALADSASPPEWLSAALRECVATGLTPVVVMADGLPVALAALGDSIRPDAAAAVAGLRRAGWRVGVLSGDHPEAVSAVASRLGIDAALTRGGLTPEDKLAIVAAHSGPVVMVGDGVNDSAALAAAGVGIAVHGGAEASLAAADVYLNRPGLGAINDLLVASDRTMRVIRRNLGVSLFYNAVAATLAITGIINPLIAAILMPASSLTVLTVCLKSRTFGEAPCR